jgi:thioredoxin-related protein
MNKTMLHLRLIIPCILLLLLSLTKLSGQKKIPPSEIDWYSFPVAMQKAFSENKPVFIDVYTDWCGWCKRMMREAFADSIVENYINTNFYAAKFNAESSDPVKVQNMVFRDTVIQGKKIHQLALRLLNGRPAYPTLVYITPDGKQHTKPGYLKSDGLMTQLVYYAEKGYLSSISYDQFKSQFNKSFPDLTLGETNFNSGIDWRDIETAVEKNDSVKKPFFLFLYKKGYSTQMLVNNLFSEAPILEYINAHFIAGKFDAFSTDTVNFGMQFINPGKEDSYHQFAVALLQDKVGFPAFLFFDVNDKLVFYSVQYATPEEFIRMLEFVKKGKYKETGWQEYNK